jgi:UDP-2,3-diacylglucosamine pyrophosphatase LpxH
MFKLLNQTCKEKGINPSEFWVEDKKIWAAHKDILCKIRLETNWKGTKNELLRRIRKVALKSSFSAREVKLLRKLVNEQKKNGYTNFEEIQYYFPGKTVEMMEEKYNEKYSYLARHKNI